MPPGLRHTRRFVSVRYLRFSLIVPTQSAKVAFFRFVCAEFDFLSFESKLVIKVRDVFKIKVSAWSSGENLNCGPRKELALEEKSGDHDEELSVVALLLDD